MAHPTGSAKLLAQVKAHIDERSGDWESEKYTQSPIECLLLDALHMMASCQITEYTYISLVTDRADSAQALSRQDPLTLIVEPQAQLEGWRVDFLVHAWEFGRISGRPQWRRLIVECDGHDFHERTKEQAAKDRSRDREFQLRGFGVMRFTGSEIVNDPLGCACQISEWGTMGW